MLTAERFFKLEIPIPLRLERYQRSVRMKGDAGKVITEIIRRRKFHGR